MTKRLWEILVPTTRRVNGKPIKTRYHRVWDAKVRDISGGLTIMPPAKGQWVCPSKVLFAERMIPVRFVATDDEARDIANMTLSYYDQLAVMYYTVSDNVIIISKEDV